MLWFNHCVAVGLINDYFLHRVAFVLGTNNYSSRTLYYIKVTWLSTFNQNRSAKLGAFNKCDYEFGHTPPSYYNNNNNIPLKSRKHVVTWVSIPMRIFPFCSNEL